jgi:beta-lactamase superfamily II metal-dependent hydrolase
LRVVHRGHAILLTGDLESPGLDQVTRGPGGGADVMMSPHHGSAAANTRSLAQWARPRLVVVPDSKAPKARKDDPYTALRAEVWVTDLDGAVTVRSNTRGLIVDSFRTRRRLELSSETE